MSASTPCRLVLFSWILPENFGRVLECGNGDGGTRLWDSLASLAIGLGRRCFGQSGLFVCDGANPLCGRWIYRGLGLADSGVGCLSGVRRWGRGLTLGKLGKFKERAGSDR